MIWLSYLSKKTENRGTVCLALPTGHKITTLATKSTSCLVSLHLTILKCYEGCELMAFSSKHFNHITK